MISGKNYDILVIIAVVTGRLWGVIYANGVSELVAIDGDLNWDSKMQMHNFAYIICYYQQRIWHESNARTLVVSTTNQG